MNKIRPASIPDKSKVAPLPTGASSLSSGSKVVFSFADFQCVSYQDSQFCNKFRWQWEFGRFMALLMNRLSSFSTMTAQDIKSGGKATRCHTVVGDQRVLLESILLNINFNAEKLQQIEAFYQLSLGTGSGRVMGYFIGSTYYIVLFDPYHLIYSGQKKSLNQDLLNSYDPWEDSQA